MFCVVCSATRAVSVTNGHVHCWNYVKAPFLCKTPQVIMEKGNIFSGNLSVNTPPNCYSESKDVYPNADVAFALHNLSRTAEIVAMFTTLQFSLTADR